MCPSVTFVCKVNALISYELMKSYDIRSYEQKKTEMKVTVSVYLHNVIMIVAFVGIGYCSNMLM